MFKLLLGQFFFFQMLFSILHLSKMASGCRYKCTWFHASEAGNCSWRVFFAIIWILDSSGEGLCAACSVGILLVTAACQRWGPFLAQPPLARPYLGSCRPCRSLFTFHLATDLGHLLCNLCLQWLTLLLPSAVALQACRLTMFYFLLHSSVVTVWLLSHWKHTVKWPDYILGGKADRLPSLTHSGHARDIGFPSLLFLQQTTTCLVLILANPTCSNSGLKKKRKWVHCSEISTPLLSDSYLPLDFLPWLYFYFRIGVEGTSFLCSSCFHVVRPPLKEHSSLSLMSHLVLWRWGAWRNSTPSPSWDMQRAPALPWGSLLCLTGTGSGPAEGACVCPMLPVIE